MAITLGDAVVNFAANTKPLDKAQRQSERKTRNWVQSVGGQVQQVGTIALGAFAGLAAGATAGAIGLGKFALDSTLASASVKELRSTLGVLGERAGWSESEIDANVQTMKDLGITSDTAMRSLSEFARQQLDVEDATMAARAAQDLAVLSQRDSSETLDELIYGIKTQNSSLQVFRDLGIQAGSVLKDYAEEMGVAVDELDETERQQAMLNAVREEATKIEGLYTNAMEESSKKLRSFPRYFQEIQESVGAHFQDAMDTAVFGAADLVAGLQGLMEEGEPLSRIFGALGDIVSSVVTHLFGMAEGSTGLYDTLDRVAGVVEEVSSYIQFFFLRLQWGEGVLDSVIVVLELMGLEGLAGLITWVREAIAAVREFLAPVMQWLKENIKLKDILLGLGAAIATVVIPIILTLMQFLLPIIATFAAITLAAMALRKAWETNFLGIQDKTKAAWAAIKPLLQKAWEWLKINIPLALESLRVFWVEVAWPAIQKALEIAWPIIKGIFKAVRAFVENVLIPAIANLRNAWVNITWPAIQRAIEVAWPIIERVFNAVRDFVVGTLIPTIKDLYTTWVEDVWPEIQRATENVWEIISVVFEEIGRWINDNIVPWIEYLGEVWSDTVWPAIQEALEAAWDVIEPIWEKLEEWLAVVLPPVIEGLKDAFDTAMGAISKAVSPVKDLWDDFVSAIQGFWDWISGKVFNFKLSIPDLPAWALPGSPLPIHAAWEDFAREMNRIKISPEIDVSPFLTGQRPGQSLIDRSKTLNLTMQGNYRPQDRPAITEDVRALAMQYGMG